MANQLIRSLTDVEDEMLVFNVNRSGCGALQLACLRQQKMLGFFIQPETSRQ